MDPAAACYFDPVDVVIQPLLEPIVDLAGQRRQPIGRGGEILSLLTLGGKFALAAHHARKLRQLPGSEDCRRSPAPLTRPLLPHCIRAMSRTASKELVGRESALQHLPLASASFRSTSRPRFVRSLYSLLSTYSMLPESNLDAQVIARHGLEVVGLVEYDGIVIGQDAGSLPPQRQVAEKQGMIYDQHLRPCARRRA